jgi:alpha-tubulin suppressor-like RCC1 family protein
MTVYYKSRQWGRDVDLDDLYVRKSVFLSSGIWAWGTNGGGNFFDSTTTSRSSPIQVITSGNIWKQLSAGLDYTFGIKSDGTLWGSGANGNGQLGNNGTVALSSPVQTVTGGNNWYQVSCGYYTTAAIKTDGSLWIWGLNSSGQLGDNTVTSKSSPVQTITASRDWKQVSVGNGRIGAIKTDGTLWMWGSGTLGDNTNTSRSSPVQTIAGGNNWRSISAAYSTAAIKTDGTLWTWGINADGALGDNTVTDRSSPVQTISGGSNWKSLAQGVSYYVTAAIKTDGTLWTWGYNFFGQLGDNTRTRKSSPVQTVAGGNNWARVAAGDGHVGAVKTDGTIWLWGYNASGQLGTNNTVNRSSPVQTVASGANWVDTTLGLNHTIAIRL